MTKEELKEKFKRIYNLSKRINLQKINKIFESIKRKEKETKLPSTITEISIDVELNSNTVRNYLGYLQKEGYTKKKRKYTPPFLKSTNRRGDSDFTYGKDNRDKIVDEESKKVISVFDSSNINLNSELEENLRIIKNSNEYNSRYLKAYNSLIEYLWDNSDSEDFVKLEIGSGANRYLIN